VPLGLGQCQAGHADPESDTRPEELHIASELEARPKASMVGRHDVGDFLATESGRKIAAIQLGHNFPTVRQIRVVAARSF
jgi:hypothetical protein